jgi:hypothetical protein
MPRHHALFTVTHFFSQNIQGIQFDPRILMFPEYPLKPYFVFHQCIYLFIPFDDHLHMLALKKMD